MTFQFIITFQFVKSIFFFLDLYIALRSRSKLEQFIALVIGEAAIEDEHAWNLGVKGNLGQIFGRDWKKWMLPVPSSLGDGLGFPQRNHSDVPMTINNGKHNGNGSHVSLKSVVIVNDEVAAVNV